MSQAFDSIDKFLVAGGVTVVAGLVVIAILVLVGMGYLTSVSFGNKKMEDLTDTQRNLTRMGMVLFWMGFAINVLYVFALAMKGQQRSTFYYF